MKEKIIEFNNKLEQLLEENVAINESDILFKKNIATLTNEIVLMNKSIAAKGKRFILAIILMALGTIGANIVVVSSITRDYAFIPGMVRYHQNVITQKRQELIINIISSDFPKYKKDSIQKELDKIEELENKAN